jgi:hypothetical protein
MRQENYFQFNVNFSAGGLSLPERQQMTSVMSPGQHMNMSRLRNLRRNFSSFSVHSFEQNNELSK